MIETSDASVIRPAWESVFATNDAFVWPFRRKLEVGRIFYPTDGYHLSREQYSIVCGALQDVGETEFFLSIVESKGLEFLERSWGHWKCELPSYDEYCNLSLTLENSIYSKHGHWGILISHEMHALIGGTEAFMDEVGKRYKEWAEDLRLLSEAWSGNPNADWLPAIIKRAAR